MISVFCLALALSLHNKHSSSWAIPLPGWHRKTTTKWDCHWQNITIRVDYNNRPSNTISFIPTVGSTSDHLHCDLVILLFLESHWETDLNLLSEVSVRILKTDRFYRKSRFNFRVSAKSRFNFREFFCSSLLKTQPLSDTVKTMEIVLFGNTLFWKQHPCQPFHVPFPGCRIFLFYGNGVTCVDTCRRET